MQFSTFFRSLGMIFPLLVLGGCQPTLMVTPATDFEPQASADKALVVFLFPTPLAGMELPIVYAIRAEESDTLIGVVYPKTKVAYLAEPGEQLFMLASGNTEFLAASLQAGKRYYVLVTPQPWVLRARYSLLPIRNDADAKDGLQSEQFRKWYESTQWVAISPRAHGWHQENIESIRARKREHLPKWQNESAAYRAERTLRSVDGL